MDLNLLSEIKRGAIGVLATDTIYGLVGSALNKKTVERMYKVRRRDPEKPFLILISSLNDLKKFKVDLKSVDQRILRKYWPGKITIILSLTKSGVSKFKYLHRGRGTLAFRYPYNTRLISLLKKTGPLVAPSANIAGDEPAKNLKEARAYFGEKVDFYVTGRVSKKPSKIISFTDGVLSVIRK